MKTLDLIPRFPVTHSQVPCKSPQLADIMADIIQGRAGLGPTGFLGSAAALFFRVKKGYSAGKGVKSGVFTHDILAEFLKSLVSVPAS
jgi:hypothetical protein